MTKVPERKPAQWPNLDDLPYVSVVGLLFERNQLQFVIELNMEISSFVFLKTLGRDRIMKIKIIKG